VKGKKFDREKYWFQEFGIRFPDGSKVTETYYNAEFAAQDGKCAICKKDQLEFSRRFALDHDHTSGYPRGLLCLQCNAALAVYEVNHESLRLYFDKYNSSKGVRQLEFDFVKTL